MNVLVVGRGGREHAICKKAAESPLVENVFCAPGNAGISRDAHIVDIDEMNFKDIASFAKEQKVGLVIVGPENPLEAGITDYLKKEGLNVFGPNQNAAILEGSKSFSKMMMEKYNIPTARYQSFEDYDAAKAYIEQEGAPIVLKADGLAAGKGVTVAMTLDEALTSLEDMMLDKKFGDASARVVVEQYLQGEEYSLMAFVHGENVYPMEAAQDHKRAFDNDEGPNTGGMGAYSPVPHISQAINDQSVEEIIRPIAKGMVQEGRSFTGIIFAGLMLTEEGPKTIEFNARFGDPETQVVLPRLENDLIQVMLDVLDGKDPELSWKDESVLGIVLAAKGYPEAYEKGNEVKGLDNIESASVIHAGTYTEGDGVIRANGGRVLLVTGSGANPTEAQKKAYVKMKNIDTENFFYRSDIGSRAISKAGL
ncbi:MULTISPECIES: phosphoribosylamine--glycine ligase [Bacillaceae]|uniref:Phosphoribosylamine--glycine ligase n=1 Tax=Domibacillus aminovorans TaxID=29332 RepID=A0A177KK45_9BACI|nr:MULTISPECIES: phosphoribosylamine--glycine ligase [Bacillaceae]OAH53265.1 phosphoribosylamine--glycine ligase [Domibacillus aminovorans]OAH62464.1 phosphoribosylamine--glycine ligase [Domibacillus aminovorans]